jgi:lipopolysaccharide transport system ATP-binding protein
MQDVSKGEGRTVLFVSHNMASIRQLCTTGVLLENGMVKYAGDIDETIERYLATSTFRECLIKDAITECKEVVKINNVKVNECTSNHVAISIKRPEINVVVAGHLYEPQKMGLEIRLSDSSGTSIALYSPHHGNSPLLPAGDFVINETMTLPSCLMSGDYLCSMYLTNSSVEGLVDIPNAFLLEVDGCATPNGFQFSYNSQTGFLYLK